MSSTYNPLAWQRQKQLHDSELDTSSVAGPGKSPAEALADTPCPSAGTRRGVAAEHPAQPLQGPSLREPLPLSNRIVKPARQEGFLSSILQLPPPAGTATSAPPGFGFAPPLQLPAAICRTTTPSYLPPHLRARPPQPPNAAHSPHQAQPAESAAAVPRLNLPAHLHMPRQQPMMAPILHAAQQSQLQELLGLLGTAGAAAPPTPVAPSSTSAAQLGTVAAPAAATIAAPPGFDLPALRLGPVAPDAAPVAIAIDPAIGAIPDAESSSRKPRPPGFETTLPGDAAALTWLIPQHDQPGITAAMGPGPSGPAADAEGTVPDILAAQSSEPPAAAALTGSTAAAGLSSAAAAAPEVVAPTWAAAVSSTPPPAAGTPASLPRHSQQQQQQQQYAPQQPRPTFSVMLDRLHRDLDSSTDSRDVSFSLKEGLKWLQGYDANAGHLVDKPMKEYLEFIKKDQGLAVLSCVVFFAMGHHDAFRGDLPMLTLGSADHPAKVLNKRLSYYRTLFSLKPRKLELLAALVAHKPDVASHLTHRLVQRLFNNRTDTEAAAAVTAGLLLLPQGWEEACADPHQYVNSFVAAVLQDTSNADKMVAHLDGKIQAAAADVDSDGDSSSSSIATAAEIQAMEAHIGQQQQQPAARMAWSRSSSASSSAADISRAAAAAAVTAAQQQLPVRSAGGSRRSSSGGGADTLSAGIQQRQQQLLLQEQSSSNHSSRHPSPGVAKAAVAAAAAAAGDRSATMAAADSSGSTTGSNSSSNKSDLIELALKQLQVDRPDVMKYMTRDLRDRIRTLVPEAAVAAVGELMILPKGWEARFAKTGDIHPTEYLSRVVERAAAHTTAASSSSTADGGDWVTLDQRSNATTKATSNGNANVSSMDNKGSTTAMRYSSSSSNVIGKGMNVSAAWRKLEVDKPWLTKHLKDKHRTETRSEYGEALTASQQLQVLSVLDCVNPGTVNNANDADATLMNIIRKAKALVLQPTPKPLQVALDVLSQRHPQVMQYFDPGMYSTLHNLAMRHVGKAVAAVGELQDINFPKDLEKKYKNPSGFLMAIVAKHAK